MGHAFEISRDQIAGMDEMAALGGTITQALRGARALSSAQRAYDDRADDRADRDAANDARAEAVEKLAREAADDALTGALYGAELPATLRSVEGPHTPATLVSTLLGAEDAEVNDLMVKALRLACGPHHPNVMGQRDAQAAQALREVAALLCERFAGENWHAYAEGVTL